MRLCTACGDKKAEAAFAKREWVGSDGASSRRCEECKSSGMPAGRVTAVTRAAPRAGAAPPARPPAPEQPLPQEPLPRRLSPEQPLPRQPSPPPDQPSPELAQLREVVDANNAFFSEVFPGAQSLADMRQIMRIEKENARTCSFNVSRLQTRLRQTLADVCACLEPNPTLMLINVDQR